ncbi:hypothetical protein PUN28_020056 [Cardiocondyla obscurior]|uniref:Uncharacterized protein n=1 Tax=Cardiocondyla obscurior TaxID=286306 RepID=A0AAW2EA11_9HYME
MPALRDVPRRRDRRSLPHFAKLWLLLVRRFSLFAGIVTAGYLRIKVYLCAAHYSLRGTSPRKGEEIDSRGQRRDRCRRRGGYIAFQLLRQRCERGETLGYSCSVSTARANRLTLVAAIELLRFEYITCSYGRECTTQQSRFRGRRAMSSSRESRGKRERRGATRITRERKPDLPLARRREAERPVYPVTWDIFLCPAPLCPRILLAFRNSLPAVIARTRRFNSRRIGQRRGATK